MSKVRSLRRWEGVGSVREMKGGSETMDQLMILDSISFTARRMEMTNDMQWR